MVSGNYPTFFLVLHWQYRGDTEGTVVPEERGWKVVYLFILLSSEKNEPRSAAAVIHVLFLLTPPSYGHLPYILRCKTPRNTTGHGREEGDSNLPLKQSSPFSPYCYRNFPQCYETRQGGGWEVFHFLPCFYFKCDTLSCYSCGNIGEWLDSNSSVKVRRGSQTNFIKERAVSNSVWSNDTALPF